MNDTVAPGMRATTVNLPLYCMADRPSSTALRWQAVGSAAMGLTFAQPCTGTTFVLMCGFCCLMDQSQEILLGHASLVANTA